MTGTAAPVGSLTAKWPLNLRMPRPVCQCPAIILELKYNQSADTAITQIHEKRYAGKLQKYVGEVVLVGINYDKKSKLHDCKIERIYKN